MRHPRLCRKHHLLKTFWGWHDQQFPDGTVVWTSPHGQRYSTHPGSRLLFPTLCRPTAPVVLVDSVAPATSAGHRGLAMPRRSRTRAHNRAKAIDDERAHNQAARHAETQHQAREQVHKPQPEWVNDYFPPTPPPPNDNDPPPF